MHSDMELVGQSFQSNTKPVSWRPALIGLASLLFGLWLTHEGLTPSYNKCGNLRSEGDLLVIGPLFALFGSWRIWVSFAHSIAWSDQNLTVRSVFGKEVTADFSDLTDVIYLQNKTLIEFGERHVVVRDWVSGATEFHEVLIDAINRYAPHLSYVPAMRGMKDEAGSAGCLRCGSLFEPSDIVSWEETDAEVNENDLAICPACQSSEALVFAPPGNSVTPAGIEKWNESLMTNMDEAEKASRLDEIRTAREAAQKLNLADI